MRQLVLVIAVVAFAVSPAAAGGGGITGTWSTTVKTPADIKGKWVLAIGKGGAYRVKYAGEWIGRGTYTATATTITFRESAQAGCGGTGTYAWKRSGRTLTFTQRREVRKCAIRGVVLQHRFTRVG